MEATFALFGEHRLGYGLVETGLVFTYIGVVSAVVQGGLVGRVSRRIGETRTLLAGLWGTGLALALVPACHSTWALLPVVLLLAAASGLVFPTVTAMFSRAAGVDDQGGLLGVLASTGGLARILAPVAATALFEHVGIADPLPDRGRPVRVLRGAGRARRRAAPRGRCLGPLPVDSGR